MQQQGKAKPPVAPPPSAPPPSVQGKAEGKLEGQAEGNGEANERPQGLFWGEGEGQAPREVRPEQAKGGKMSRLREKLKEGKAKGQGEDKPKAKGQAEDKPKAKGQGEDKPKAEQPQGKPKVEADERPHGLVWGEGEGEGEGDSQAPERPEQAKGGKMSRLRERIKEGKERFRDRVGEGKQVFRERVTEMQEQRRDFGEKVKERVKERQDNVRERKLEQRRVRRPKGSGNNRVVGRLEVTVLALRGLTWKDVYIEMDVDFCEPQKLPTVQVDDGNQCAWDHDKRTLSFDVYDINSDLQVYLMDQGFAKFKPKGRVFVPLCTLPRRSLWDRSRGGTYWFEVFPLNSKLQRADKYCSGLAGTPGSAMVEPKNDGFPLMHMSLRLTFAMNPLQTYFLRPASVPDTAASSVTDPDPAPKFNPREFKQNLLRLTRLQQSSELALLAAKASEFPQSLLLLPLWWYLCLFFEAWHFPALAFVLVVVSGAVAKKYENDMFRWVVLWESELPPSKFNPIETYLNASAQISTVQAQMGNAATRLEKIQNAFNWTDKAVTVLSLAVLAATCSVLTVLLYFVSLNLILLAVGSVLILRVIWRGMACCAKRTFLTPREQAQLRSVWAMLDANGDGLISPKELNTFLRRQREDSVTDEEFLGRVQRVLEGIPTNSRGDITWEQFVRAHQAIGASHVRQLAEAVRPRSRRKQRVRERLEGKEKRDANKPPSTRQPAPPVGSEQGGVDVEAAKAKPSLRLAVPPTTSRAGESDNSDAESVASKSDRSDVGPVGEGEDEERAGGGRERGASSTSTRKPKKNPTYSLAYFSSRIPDGPEAVHRFICKAQRHEIALNNDVVNANYRRLDEAALE